MATLLAILVRFLFSLIISSIIIYVASKAFGQKEGLGSAILAAVVGSVIYGAAYFIFGQDLIASMIGGIVWLLALKGVYDIGWGRALVIAIIVWILATVIGFFLPTLTGPL